MDELNLFSIFYIAFRLAPFILVSFFALLSIMNQDLKGLIYLAGLLITISFAVVFGNTMKSIGFLTPTNNTNAEMDIYESTTKVCNLLTLSKSGPISIIPLSIIIFSFTFFYLFYGIQFVAKNINNNIPTIIVFPMIIVMDALWHIYNKCNNPLTIIMGLIIGGGFGLLWGYVLDISKANGLQYFNGLSTKEICNVPTKQNFKCTMKSGVALNQGKTS